MQSETVAVTLGPIRLVAHRSGLVPGDEWAGMVQTHDGRVIVHTTGWATEDAAIAAARLDLVVLMRGVLDAMHPPTCEREGCEREMDGTCHRCGAEVPS